MAIQRTREEVAELIGDFLNGRGCPWDWDDFISTRIDDPELDDIRRLSGELPDLYPPEQKGLYCGERGLQVLADLRNKLRAK